MIQILGLRPYTDKKTGAVKLATQFHEKGWRVESIYELFKNAEAYVKMVPEDQRWNLFYTVANCTEEERVFGDRQDVLPIDIDGIVRGTEGEVIDCVVAELQLPKDKIGIVYSGNGVHILIGLKSPITEGTYLRNMKPYYRALCGRINTALFEAGIQGKSDPTVFSEARLLRMPFTENRKDNKTHTKCVLVSGNIQPLEVDLVTLAQLPNLSEGDHVHPKAMLRLPKPDGDAIQSGCAFLRNCKDNQATVSEPEWYAMLSIIGRLDDGQNLVHAYSKDHIGYHPADTDEKLTHALDASGPRTCSNISTMFDGCKTCPHFNRITSPIQIVGTNTIVTLDTGFYDVVIDKQGLPKRGKPNYDDLVKFFKAKHEYVTNAESGQVYVWRKTHWEVMDQLVIFNFAEANFKPTPSHAMCKEFEAKLRRTNLVEQEFFNVEDRLNFQNGILDLKAGSVEPHSSNLGFTYCIPYEYKPTGDCPQFKKFIREVSCDESDVADLITEYMGYCLSGADPVLVQKCAVLYGDGANGKSVVLSLLRELVGAANCTSISINSLYKEQYRYQMMHKLFNASDESPSDSFIQSATFKAMVSGDPVEVRKLYAEPLMWKCTTKLIFNCNDLPYMGDFSYGMWRRLLIIPFRATFKGDKRDPMMLSKLLTERSDILKYCLDKFDSARKRNYTFTEAKASSEELSDYMESTDLVQRFVFAMCEHSKETKLVLSIDEIYRLFALWCQDNHQKPMNYGSFSRRFGKKIMERYPEIERGRPRSGDGARSTSYKYLLISAVSPGQLGSNF